MFGDVFGLRGDYSRGFFYQGRRQFLIDSPEDPCSLEPPTEFKNKRQMRKVAIQHHNEVNFCINFKKNTEEKSDNNQVVKASNRKQEIRRSRNKPRLIEVDMYSSTNPNDWEESVQAGCKMWINKKTGEVSSRCPYDLDSIAEESQPDLQQDGGDLDNDGTGCLVYDCSEVNDLFNMLDRASRSTKSGKK